MTELTNDRIGWGSGLLTACKNQIIPLFAFTFVLNLAASAAVPLRWTVETSRATPAQFEAYQGETLDLEATLQSSGKPVELTGIAALYWQTNGMGSTYWEASAAVNSNRMSAVWTPEMDVGSKVYNCFIGQPGTIYHAAFQLRLRPSPGATPNVLPLPTPVIDFAKVRVINPPWEGGGGGGINTNAVIDIIHKTVSGAARPLPPYLHAIAFDDTYPADAAWLYAQLGPSDLGRCSAVRRGGKLWRNYDWTFDSSAEFAVKVSGNATRFASVGMASVGSRLTENDVTSGVYSRYYRCLPGMTLDGINEKGVVCEINVDGGPKDGWHGDAAFDGIHILAAVRWALDHGESAQMAAEWLADHIVKPTGEMNFHFMVADAEETYTVENGVAHLNSSSLSEGAMLTNFAIYDDAHEGGGQERFFELATGSDIKSVWFTNAYQSGNDWDSDFDSAAQHAEAIRQWAEQGTDKESHRGKTTSGGKAWWQSVHTTEYDFAAKTMKVAVQETDEWFTFAVDANGVTEVAWEDVKNKPTAFPPSSHTHPQSQVEGLADALAAKRGMTDRVWYVPSFHPDQPTDWTLRIAKLEESELDVTEDDVKQHGLYPIWYADPQHILYMSWGIVNGLRILSTNVNERTLDYVDTVRVRIQTGPTEFIEEDIQCRIVATRKVVEAGDTLALTSEIPAPYTPSAADPDFSNAVVEVDLSLGHTRSAVLSAAADFYRTGRDGEVGTGWAYTAIEGTGDKRFAAEVPSFGTTIILTPADAYDPIVSAFGDRFNGASLVREISFLGSASVPGRYDVAEADFSMTNGIPVVATVRRNILSPSPSVEGVSVTDTYTWLEFDTPDGVHHGCYGFYAVGSTVYYTDEWSTTSDWGVEDHSFEVSASDPCEAKYETVVFGSAGTLQTEEGVTDAVTDYIQNHSIQKEVLVERTGLDGEFGDGWGYKVYDWTSEYRMWRLVVPRLDVTTTATAARTQDSQYYGIVGNYSQYPSNPMLDYGLAPGCVTEGVSVTHGKTSPDRCTSADLTYSAWVMPGSGSDVVSAVAAGLTYGSSQYGFEVCECAIPSDAVYEIDLYVPGYYSNVSNVFHCTMTNFRPSGSSVTYDNTVHCWSWRNGMLFTEGEFTTHPSFGFSTLRYASSFKSVTINATRIADTETAHYFWDPGMRCTWRIGVTNGCFFTSKVADGNLTGGGN